MADIVIIAMCYMNGRMKYGPDGVGYDGPPTKAVRINRGIQFVDLQNKLCQALKIAKEQNMVKIIYRYPQVVQPTLIQYVPIPIEDDDDVEILFDTLLSHSGLSGVELYLEVEGIEPRVDEEVVTNLGDDMLGILTQDPQSNSGPQLGSSTGMDIGTGTYGCEPRVDLNLMQQMANAEGHTYLAPINDCSDIPEDMEDEEAEWDGFHENEWEEEEEEASKEEGQVEREVGGQDIPRSSGSHGPPSMPCSDSSRPMHVAPSPYFKHLDQSTINVPVTCRSTLLPYEWDDSQELFKGLRFNEKIELQNVVKSYSVKRNQEFVVVRSEPRVWVIRCKKSNTGCKWRLRALQRKTHGHFEITQYGVPHTCVLPMLSQDHSQLDARLIANNIYDMVKAAVWITVAQISAFIKSKYGYICSYKKLWIAKQMAIARIYGSWEMSYQVCPKWMHAVKEYNPGSWVKWVTKPGPSPDCAIFDRVFWTFAPAVEGFNHCRPVISIDATHLYGKYRGKMMIATSLDGANQIYPLAFAIVDEESHSTWYWFLMCLRSYVTKRQGICLISGQHEGIISAIADEQTMWQPPYGYHRFCMFHLTSNFNHRFPKTKLKDLVNKTALQTQLRKFDKGMQKIRSLSPDAADWLENIPLEQWAVAHDAGRRYGVMTTNLSEVFNKVLKGARNLPITACAQLTFYRIAGYFDDRRAQSEASMKAKQKHTPYVLEKILSRQLKASAHEVKKCDMSTDVFSVQTAIHGQFRDKGNNVQVVKLSEKTCTCGKWQCYRIPCSHVMAVCAHVGVDVFQFVGNCYTESENLASYAPQFKPIPHEDYWTEPEMPTLYPNHARLREKGRPRSTRLRNEMDWKENWKEDADSKKRCGLCREEGHDKRKCPKH